MLQSFPSNTQFSRLCLPLLALTLTTLPATAQEVSRTFVAGTLPDNGDPPVIDGRVDDALWQGVKPYTDFTQQDPTEGAPATEQTEVRLIVGRGQLYVGIICFDSDPTKIIVSQARRDASLNETDSVIMVFDTFNDNQNAFVFGTNPIGIEYDGQVAREGQTSGLTFQGGAGGTQRGGISAFNPNWDGDWTVRSQVTERGWETEMAIPLKTLRYSTGADRTWGFNVLRNIRHKNEQVYLAPIPRGFDIYRVSLAAKVSGLDLPARRDIKLIPYVLGSANKDFTRAQGDQLDRNADVGVDLKWGIRPNLTLDATLNTDFAQVEADEEQVNLTRFDLFFPEKRPFFLENASTFQFGQPQSIDLFFTRRIGLSPTGVPIDILGGGRLSGKVAGDWNVGLLNIQTDDLVVSGRTLATENNYSVLRAQKEVGRSTYGGIFVGRYATGETGAGVAKSNRAYGVDANVQIGANQRFSSFIARTDTPGTDGSDYAGRAFYNFTNNLWQLSGGYSQVGDRFNPEVGFLPRRGYRRPEFRAFFQPQPKGIPWIRRFAPHYSYNSFWGFDDALQTSMMHVHPLEIQPARGGRFGWFFDRNQDNPLVPFVVYNRDGKRVAVPAGQYTWYQNAFEYFHDPSARVSGTIRARVGNFYDGDFNSVEITSDYRISSRMIASLGWTRQDIDLPTGSFVTNLVPMKASYAFTTLASLSALVQYNGQTAQFSANIRLALLNRSGTGLFIVYNDRRDTTSFTPDETLGRSFVVKYTRLFDF
ncbi:MAG: carbohydrate binding family 9 domain-containing protein [Acidobacteria bacterium]|nr:carbohydrate binding family 9 domain-containing protein [Acidobacteriota bacterium]